MAELHESVAALRIGGDALDPDEITMIMRCAPTDGFRKGQILRGVKTGRDYVKKTGMWILEAIDRQPANLDAQVAEVLDKLPDDLEIWRKLSSLFEIDLFCGFFMEGSDEGLMISPESLRRLGERGISLSFCIYAPSTSVPETSQGPSS